MQNFFIVTFYVLPRHNKKNFLKFLDKYFETFVNNKSIVIMCCDFNRDGLCHSSMCQQIENIICTNGLHLLVSGKNRQTTISESSLDHLLTSFDKIFCAIETMNYDITDHFPVLLHWRQNLYQIKKIDFVHRSNKFLVVQNY